jgi:hypothetical protein
MRRYLFVLILFSSGMLRAQDSSTRWKWNPVDSYHNALMNVPGFRLGFDSRNSLLGGVPVTVNGLRYGLNYGKMALWTGYYSSRLFRAIDTDTFNLGFNYVSSTIEYYVHQSWRFEVVNSFQLGIGNSWEYRKSGQNFVKYRNGVIVPVEFGLGGTVRFLRYFGFYAGVGVRVGVFNSTSFTGPYWSYGLTYFTGTMYRDAKKAWGKIKG